MRFIRISSSVVLSLMLLFMVVPGKADEVINGEVMMVRIVESPKMDTILSAIAIAVSIAALVYTRYSTNKSFKQTLKNSQETLTHAQKSLKYTAKSIAHSKETIELQKQHNIDMVLPLVSLHCHTKNISIAITNHGLGPAKLKSMKWIDSKNHTEYETILSLLEDRRLSGNYFAHPLMRHDKPFRNDPDDPDYLAPQESLVFLKGDLKTLAISEKRKLYKVLEGIKIELCYTDVYESNDWYIKADFSWFSSQI